MAKKLSPYGVDIIKTCMAFGITLGLQLYIIGVLFGGWLDQKLGTAPLFLMLGLLTAIFISFFRLIADFKKAVEAEEKRNAGKPKNYINYDAVFAQADSKKLKDKKENSKNNDKSENTAENNDEKREE